MTATTDPAEETTSPSSATADQPPDDPVPPGRSRLTSPVLIGRTAEFAELREAARRPPALVVIEGEAGIGKTRLVRQWLAEPDLADTARLVGHCTALREPFPFGSVIDALAGAAAWLPGPERLSPVTGALRPLLPELAEHLPPSLEPLGSARQERHRVFRGVRDLLAGLGPAILVLEDLHWIDNGTRELLRFLVGRLPARLTLVITYRREDLDDPTAPALPGSTPADMHRSQLVLRQLDHDQVAQLVATIYRTRVPAEFTGALHRLTMGVPLAVEETLGLLWDRQPEPPIPTWSLPADLDVPSVLREALLERVSRLSGSGRRLLHAAAVLGTPATDSLLTRVAGLSGRHATAGLVELLGRALLRPDDGRYTIRQGLAQRAVYESIPEPARRQLHRRAIRALAGGDPAGGDPAGGDPAPPADLARHCRAAGEVTNWVRYAEAAADQALAAGDDEAATQLLREVVSRPMVTRDTRVRLAIKLGHAALTGLSHRDALAILRRVLTEADLPRHARGELRLCLGVLLRNQAGGASEGSAELERAVAELTDRPAPAARAMASLGAPYLLDSGHIDGHLRWLTRAVDTAGQAADPELATLVRTNHASALICIGDPAGWHLARPLLGEVEPRPADRTAALRGRLAANLAWSATCVGHYQHAESLLQLGQRVAGNAPGRYLACCLTGTALLYDHAVGHWDGLAARAEEVVATMPDVPTVVAEARLVLGLLALAAGDLHQARQQLTGATASVPVAVAAAGGLARIAAASGRVSTAEDLVQEGIELVRSKGVWCWAAELAPTAVAMLGRAQQQPAARKLLDEFAAGLADRDSPLADAAATAGRAALAETDGAHLAAADQYAAAARSYHALPRPYLAAQALEAQGRCLIAAGRDGTTVLSEAMTTFERLGATWDVACCRHLLRTLGRRLPHRRGRRGYGRQLSPRERDVVRLVRTGLTNREIAETLFLSPRTVEAHVARSLRKLGLPSRRALASHHDWPAESSGAATRGHGH
jgi:DNA-binding CsgD family transcriptional regulator/tetratricopeptide (TPR) repeat protein